VGLPVVTVASGGLPIVETTRGTPVTEATNLRGVPVTKVVGKPGLPVTFETIGVGPSVPTDPFFANVVLLMGFEGPNGSTTTGMTDESSSPHAIALAGQVQITTANFKFGTSSLLSDGTGDSLSSPSGVDWDLSPTNSSPFTMECWARPTTASPVSRALIWRGSTANSLWFAFWIDTGGQLALWGSTTGASFDWTVTSTGLTWVSGNWYHFAADKDATGKVRLYRDGVMVKSATPANSVMAGQTGHALTIWSDGIAGRSWLGNGDEVRITKGVARYATDTSFTVPAAAFPRS
jgi:Concanavalin A-like lectin/glucanases superfamily